MPKKDREAELLAEAEKQVAPFHAEPAASPAPEPAPEPALPQEALAQAAAPTGTLLECLSTHPTPWGIVGPGWRVKFTADGLTFINPKGVERVIRPATPLPPGLDRQLLATGFYKILT